MDYDESHLAWAPALVLVTYTDMASVDTAAMVTFTERLCVDVHVRLLELSWETAFSPTFIK